MCALRPSHHVPPHNGSCGSRVLRRRLLFVAQHPRMLCLFSAAALQSRRPAHGRNSGRAPVGSNNPVRLKTGSDAAVCWPLSVQNSAVLADAGEKSFLMLNERRGYHAQLCPKCGEGRNWDEDGRYHPATGTEACPEGPRPAGSTLPGEMFVYENLSPPPWA